MKWLLVDLPKEGIITGFDTQEPMKLNPPTIIELPRSTYVWTFILDQVSL